MCDCSSYRKRTAGKIHTNPTVDINWETEKDLDAVDDDVANMEAGDDAIINRLNQDVDRDKSAVIKDILMNDCENNVKEVKEIRPDIGD